MLSQQATDIIAQLQKLGLTASESKAYLAVVKSGALTAVQVAREAELQRTEIYPLMSRLASRGLVEETIDRPKRYRASNPQVAIPSLADKIIKQLQNVPTTVEEIVEKLSTLRSATTLQRSPEVRVVTGWNNIQANFFELLASAQREVWMMAGRQQIMRNRASVVAHLLKAISSKHLKARLIAELDERTATRLAKRGHLIEIRHCEGVPSHIYGFDDRAVAVGLTSSRAKDLDQSSEILVTHPETVRVMRNFFESFWEQAVPFNVWVATKEQDRGTRRRTVIWGREHVYKAVADWHLKARERILAYLPTENAPVRVSTHLRDSFLKAQDRGIKTQSLCHISSTNLAAVKEMCRFTEVRHTEASPGFAFGVLDESEAILHYIQTDTPDMICPTDISIYLTDPDAARRLGQMFDLLWKNSIPAEVRIRGLSGDESESARKPVKI